MSLEMLTLLVVVVGVLVAIFTLVVTWLLHLDSLEATWKPQSCGPFDSSVEADGTRAVLLQFQNVGKGKARQCAGRIGLIDSDFSVTCRAPNGERGKVKPGELLKVEVRWHQPWESCIAVLDLSCQTRAGRRLVQRFNVEIFGLSRFRIEESSC